MSRPTPFARSVTLTGARTLVPLSLALALTAGCRTRGFGEPGNAGGSRALAEGGKKKLKLLPEGEAAAQSKRAEYIAEGEVWSEASVTPEQLWEGPDDKVRFAHRQEVACTFHDPDPAKDDAPGGRTPKFDCDLPDGTTVKVKYSYPKDGEHAMNMEVFGEVLSTRLLWALGFAADRIYPVVVKCKGCPSDPWSYVRAKFGVLDHKDELIGFASRSRAKAAFADRTYDLAVIERKHPGQKIEAVQDQGWLWPELANVSKDASRARTQKARRDALTIVAAFLQHMDNKGEQQRLVCPKEAIKETGEGTGTCERAVLMVQDAGSSWGRGFAPLKGAVRLNKMDIVGWRQTSLWSDKARCKVRVHSAPGGSFEDTVVGEEGRALAERLFATLTDAHIKTLFEAAQVEKVGQVVNGEPVTVAAWVAAFKSKRAEIADAGREGRCP